MDRRGLPHAAGTEAEVILGSDVKTLRGGGRVVKGQRRLPVRRSHKPQKKKSNRRIRRVSS